VNKAFEQARERLANSGRDSSYQALMAKVVEESIPQVGSDEVIVECNKNDADLVRKIVADLSKKNGRLKASVSDKPIDAIGGIRVKSADGTMSFDNTLDSRIERLKPLIRKNIARMLRGEEGEE
jgi:V/A-type H+-transporting ATPase subunit E